MSATDQADTRQWPARLALRGLIALALVIDALVHLHLASGYQLSAPSGIGGGNLFRLQAVVALAAAVFVLVRGNRASYAAAFLVAVSALGAVLLYRYVDVPALGPLPAMYEPVWFPEKTLTTVAEAVAAIVAGAVLFAKRRRARAAQMTRHIDVPSLGAQATPANPGPGPSPNGL